jgi:hypothetical protein
MRILALRRVVPVLLIAMMALAAPALGQAPESRPTPRGERIIEAFLIWRLVDELDLSEQQVVRVLPRIKALKNIRFELGRRVPRLLREIRQINAQTPRNEDLLAAKVAELNGLRAELEGRRRRELQGIAAVLHPDQQAKFAFIQESFETQTLRLLEEMRRIVEDPSTVRR